MRGTRFWHRRALAQKPRRFDVRRPSRRELRELLLVNGLGLGGFVGLAVGLEPGVELGLGLAAGLVSGLVGQVFGLTELWRRKPSPTARAADPIEVYRSDRRHSLVYGLVGLGLGLVAGTAAALLVGLAAQAVAGALVGLAAGSVVGAAAGSVAGLVAGLVAGSAAGSLVVFRFGLQFGLGPAAQLTATELFWRGHGQRVRFMPLLQTALDRQVLRRVGAVYQFRHAALQDLLTSSGAAEPPDAGVR